MVLDHVLVHQDDAGALHAAVRAFAGVGRRVVLVLLLHVRAQVGRLREAAAAQRALERLLAGVHDHVVEQRLTRDEALVAYGAHEQLLARVQPLVHVQVPLPLERLAAVVAFEGELLRLLLLQQEGREPSESPKGEFVALLIGELTCL